MAAQKHMKPYSEPWADELRAELQRIAGSEECKPEVSVIVTQAIELLDAFIAETPELVAKADALCIDLGGDYPRLCKNGDRFAYTSWYGDMTYADAQLSLHFSPSVAIREVSRPRLPADAADAMARISRVVNNLDDHLDDTELFWEMGLAWISEFHPETKWVYSGKRYARSETTGTLTELTPATEIEIAPAL